MMAMYEFGNANNSQFVTAEQYISSSDLPASPTAALWTDSSSAASARRRKSQLKSVSFADDVKEHDGLTTRNAIFDALITAYFVEQREISELDVLQLTGQDTCKLMQLHEDLLDMVTRINDAVELGRQCAPVLPRGGGLCTKLCPPHVPYIRVLDRVVEAAGNRVLKASAANATQQ
jgi:hypothetical protein